MQKRLYKDSESIFYRRGEQSVRSSEGQTGSPLLLLQSFGGRRLGRRVSIVIERRLILKKRRHHSENVWRNILPAFHVTLI